MVSLTDVGLSEVGLHEVGLCVVGLHVVGLRVVGLHVVGLRVVGKVGFDIGLLVVYLHHNSTSMNGLYAETMTYNVQSDAEAMSGPTNSLVEAPLLKAS
jgi:hypothetical protein